MSLYDVSKHWIFVVRCGYRRHIIRHGRPKHIHVRSYKLVTTLVDYYAKGLYRTTSRCVLTCHMSLLFVLLPVYQNQTPTYDNGFLPNERETHPCLSSDSHSLRRNGMIYVSVTSGPRCQLLSLRESVKGDKASRLSDSGLWRSPE